MSCPTDKHRRSRADNTDYSIHYFAPLSLLVATMRYVGTDYEADMEGIKESEATRRWWKVSTFGGRGPPARGLFGCPPRECARASSHRQ
jgi:hypothetical protein